LAVVSAAAASLIGAHGKNVRYRKVLVSCRAEATTTTASWESALEEANAFKNEGKHFDGIQKINMCMELFEAELGSSESKILKDPIEFIGAFQARMSPEQKDAAFKMFSCRGDLLTGLGATRNATGQYEAATKLQPNEEAKAKLEKLKRMAKLEPDADGRIPCSILTGFLGSGKTTLLNRILEANHGRRIAVIENEFGEVGIDDKLVKGGSVADEDETIIEMNNGCICCTIRGDLITGLKKLIKNSSKQGKELDGVLIETTGLADPAPVAQTFFADDFVNENIRLDGILTLVDAKHIVQHLDDEKPEGVENEAVEQIAFADRILLNKCDLVDSEAEIEDIEKRIRAINEKVPIKRTINSEVEMDYVMGIKGFSLDNIVDMDDAFLDDSHDHQHDERVSSVGIDVPGEVVQQKLNAWISGLLNDKGVDLFRSKGVLAVKGMRQKFVFQAIHMLFANSMEGSWEPDEERRCKMVFIGKNLDREELTSGFMECMAKETVGTS
jgi:G3E family GTPase